MRTSLDSPEPSSAEGPPGFQPLGGWRAVAERSTAEGPGSTASPAAAGPERTAAEAAHDFNNVLSVIRSCASELERGELDACQRELAGEILAAATRGAALARTLVERGRPNGRRGPAVVPVDVGPALASASTMLRRALGPTVELTADAEPGLPCALCDPEDLERALLNLAANARDAMPAGGELRVRAERATVGATDPVLAPGWYVRIEVTDSGSGMSPTVLRRVADPYFSTKAGGGSGLGLPTVFGAVRAAGGDARISSRPGRGTTVALLFRAARADGSSLALGAR